MVERYHVIAEVAAIMTEDPLNEKYNKLIIQEGPYADRDVENDLYFYSGVAAPYTGDNITTDIRGASNWKTASRVWDILRRKDMVDMCEARYMKIIGLNKDPASQDIKVQGGIISRLKAQSTDRTKAVLIAEDPRDSKIPLPTQSSIYAFDNFA